MKGKSHFTRAEANEIVRLIKLKLSAREKQGSFPPASNLKSRALAPNVSFASASTSSCLHKITAGKQRDTGFRKRIEGQIISDSTQMDYYGLWTVDSRPIDLVSSF